MPDGGTHVISKLTCSLVGKIQPVKILPGSIARKAYGQDEASERFVCNYGLNPEFRDIIGKSWLTITGTGYDGGVRIVEGSTHNFYVGTLFQPQISSEPDRPHPLIAAFLKAAE